MISAAVLIPIVALAAYAGAPAWDLLVLIFGGVMIAEWCGIAGRRRDPSDPGKWLPAGDRLLQYIAVTVVVSGLLYFGRYGLGWPRLWGYLAICGFFIALFVLSRNRPAAVWSTVGLFYVAIPCAAIIALRADPNVGLQQILWIVALVIVADTGAYAAGRGIGGPKLAPRISPNKTWAGLFGAIASAAIVGSITAALLGRPSPWPLAALSGALAVVEQAGDLAESAFKRHFGVKDAGHIIPGHGGALDRVDGLIAVATAVAALNEAIGSSVLKWL